MKRKTLCACKCVRLNIYYMYLNLLVMKKKMLKKNVRAIIRRILHVRLVFFETLFTVNSYLLLINVTEITHHYPP